MGRMMGLDYGLGGEDSCLKRKFRWLFNIQSNGIEVSAGSSGNEGIKTLPPSKSARPNLSYKEAEVQHLTETVYYPLKPEWKPVNLTLYDVHRSNTNHPVWSWIKKFYDPKEKAKWQGHNASEYKVKATLDLYDGCGERLEQWVFVNAWPQTVDFGDLDMSSSEIVMVDITLRYDRGYIEE